MGNHISMWASKAASHLLTLHDDRVDRVPESPTEGGLQPAKNSTFAVLVDPAKQVGTVKCNDYWDAPLSPSYHANVTVVSVYKIEAGESLPKSNCTCEVNHLPAPP